MAHSAETYDDNIPAFAGQTLRRGDRLLRGQYRIERFLGAGGFGITYLATDSLDRWSVIKECFPQALCHRVNSRVEPSRPDHAADFDRIVKHFGVEARRLAKLSHPNIVGVHQVFEDNGTAYIALDFVRGRDLLDSLRANPAAFTPARIKDILIRLLEAVQYLHDRDILHRDIAPDNILLTDAGDPILIDFGAAEDIAAGADAHGGMQSVKDGYSPQEFYLPGAEHTPASDLYALAATVYHLIVGHAPADSRERLAALAEDAPDPFQPVPAFTKGYDSYFLGAIERALALFPKDRIASARDWLVEIDHERRVAALLERAREDSQIDATVRALTETTNRDIAPGLPASATAPQARAAMTPGTAGAPSPDLVCATTGPRSLLSRMLPAQVWGLARGRFLATPDRQTAADRS